MIPTLMAVSIFAIMLFGYQALLSWSKSQGKNANRRRPFLLPDEDELDESTKS